MTVPSKMRIGGSKVKTGCVTCKTRRVKCDEGRPSCNRCIRAHRQCGGYPEPKPKRRSPPGKFVFIHYAADIPSPMAVDTESGLDEKKLLDSFRHGTAQELAAPFNDRAWTDALLHAATQEPAIKYALVSLSAMHGAFRNTRKAKTFHEQVQFARQYYGKSIRRVMQLNNQQSRNATIVTLVTCVLFSAIESLQEHYHSSMSHAKYGMRILSSIDNLHQCEKKDPENDAIVPLHLLRPFFLNIGIQIIAISDEIWEGLSWLNLQKHTVPQEFVFSTPEDAALQLSILTKDAVLLSNIAESSWEDFNYPNGDLVKCEQSLRQRYENWTAAFEAKIVNDDWSSEPSPWRDFEIVNSLLCINQIATRILVDTLLEPNQTCFDLYLADFKYIVLESKRYLQRRRPTKTTPDNDDKSDRKESHRPFFSLQMGVLPSLWIVCSRCRDPTIRRQALELLRNCHCREGIWDSELVARAAERLIVLEEGAAARYWQFQKHQSEQDLFDSLGDSYYDSATEDVVLKTVRDFPECIRLKRLNSTWSSDKIVDVQYLI